MQLCGTIDVSGGKGRGRGGGGEKPGPLHFSQYPSFDGQWRRKEKRGKEGKERKDEIGVLCVPIVASNLCWLDVGWGGGGKKGKEKKKNDPTVLCLFHSFPPGPILTPGGGGKG